MESLYLLIPIALMFLGVASACFLWAVNRRQFDDLERQGRSVLFEREPPKSSEQPGTTDDQP